MLPLITCAKEYDISFVSLIFFIKWNDDSTLKMCSENSLEYSKYKAPTT